MLTLSRRIDEVIVIDHPAGKIEVMLTDIRGDRVRLGIVAPRSIPIYRKEVYNAIQREKGVKRA